MNTLAACAVLAICPIAAFAAQPWQEIVVPTVSQTAASFAKPPKEYGAIYWALGFPPPKERILSDIQWVDAHGGSGYMINSGGKSPKYLSPEYFDLMKVAVDECKKRGMKIWIDGDDGYPDGLAGGRISREYPQLGMQGIVADARYTVAGGQTLSIPLPDDTLGILANPRGDAAAPPAAAPGKDVPIPADRKLKWLAPSGSTWDLAVHGAAVGHYSVVAGQTLSITIPPDTKSVDAAPRTAGGRGGRGAGGGAPPQPGMILPVPGDGQFTWTAPAGGAWEVTFVRHVYRSSPTRYGQREDGTRDKDSLYSLIDYLDPAATATYIKLVEETYGKYFGNEFGSTILGFRGDETDYTGFIPWTPKLLETFQKQKGYDLTPYIPMFFARPLTQEALRAKADYWDVWSGMFRDNFYRPMEEWCRAHHMDYMMHLNHEETMLSPFGGEGMVSNEGSFWRDMRFVGVPGVDNLNQIGPGIVADFPKIAGSAAHLYGRPQAWSEEGGGVGQEGKFIFDYQLIRGLNYMNLRGLNTAPPDDPKLLDPGQAMGWYASRSQYLLAMGRPAAQVALYHPTDSYWLGDQEADTVTVKLTSELMEHQIDFDHIDQDSLASICTLDGGELKNLSGQVYRAVVVPTSTVIQKSVLDRLRAFAAGGGKVIFVGRTPSLVVGQSFLHPEPGAPDLSFATLEPKPEITAQVIAALPSPDVQLDSSCPPVKYIHRTLQDGDLYFFMNESAQTQTRTATLTGKGTVQVWDAASGTIHPLGGVAAADGKVAVPLSLAPQESRFIVIGPLPAGAGEPYHARLGSQTLVALDGNWSLKLADKQLDTPLKTWQALGTTGFNGIAEYRKSFTAPATLPAGERIYLDLGNVGEVAHVNLNGKDFDPLAWTPFVWDVTDAVKAGDNALVVEVQVPPAGGRGGFGGAPPAAARGGATTGPTARGRAGRGARGGGGGVGNAAPAPTAGSGLIGPVKLIAE